MKKKAKKKAKSARPALDALRLTERTEPAGSVALTLNLPCTYTLLGYYNLQPSPGDMNDTLSFALVELHDHPNREQHFATYQVADVRSGLCILPHYYGETDLREAHEDFWRRTGLSVHPSGKTTKKPTKRQAWEADIVQRAQAQEQTHAQAARKAAEVAARTPPPTPTKKEKRR